MSDDGVATHLIRTITWKQGFLISIGVPLALLPTIGYTVSYLWGASILLWGLSVCQTFLQNLAIGELATVFPNVSGIPGLAQEVFRSEGDNDRKCDVGRLIGSFAAWAYWLAWAPGLAAFTITIGFYAQGLFPGLAAVDPTVLNLILGLVLLTGLGLIAARGLEFGAKLGLVLGFFTIIPLLAIVVAPFMTGHFNGDNIMASMVPRDWSWDGDHAMLVLGMMVIAQWSAGGWEAAAIYGPEYKNPSSDVPRALLICGLFCLVMAVLVMMSVVGTLGVEGILAQPISPLLPMAQMVYGDLGAMVAILSLMLALILLLQLGYSVGSRALHSMAVEGNLPRWLARTNLKGQPMRAAIIVVIFNLFLITLGNPVAVIAAASVGYVIALGIGLFAFVKARRVVGMREMERPFRAPYGWLWVAVSIGILQIPFFLIAAIYLNSKTYGMGPTLIGLVALVSFFPLWIYSQHENKKHAGPADP